MSQSIEMGASRKAQVKNPLLRWMLIGVGWTSTFSGVLGIFLPLLPTVPLLLLAAFCFSKSSERFHTWLVQHKRLGALIRDFLSSGAIPVRAKVMSIGMIWLSISLSAALVVEALWMKSLLVAIAAAVTVYLLSLPTLKGADKVMPDKTEPTDAEL